MKRRVFDDRTWLITGQHIVGADVMFAQGRRHRADDCDVLHPFCRLWQTLAELDASNRGFDRAQRATNFDRRVGFGVEGFKVAGAAVQPDQNT